MGTTSTAFTGSSQFSADFQNVISRATAIATLPITALTNDKTDLSDQAAALSGLDGKFQALRTALQGIASSLTGASFQVSYGNPVSDATRVNVNLSTGASEGSYTIDVLDPGAYATSMSSAWSTDSAPTRTYQLSLGGTKYTLSPTDNSAASVVSAINSQYGSLVHATLANVGSTAAPQYTISLQAVKLGDLQPGLLVGPASPASLQSQQAAGSNTLATSQTAQSWDSSNPATTYRLSIGGAAYDIALSGDNSAEALADAINAQYGDKVTAAVVDVGTGGTSDLRIQLTAAKPGNAQPDILANDGVSGPTSLQTQQVAGSDTRSTSQTSQSWVTTGPTLSYQLSVGGAKYSLTVADNNPDTIVSAINTTYGDKVTAAKVNVGTVANPDYRISLTAVNPGDQQPDIVVSAVNVQAQQTTGALAQYIVNDSGNTVSSNTRSVAISPGITATLLARDNGTPVNFTVTRPTSAVSDALSAFTAAYNAVVDELDKQHGATAGPLTGQSIVSALSSTLTSMATYTSDTSGIAGLHALGVDLDKTGHLTLDPFALAISDLTQPDSVTAFLGSTRSGFLKLATDSLNSLEDPAVGLLPTTQASLQDQITKMTDTITAKQAAVDQMTQNMQDQMAAADALISSMEQQYSYLSGMFQAMQTASQQYR
ncbi:MAG TPA: flagellar filament capping protein FliD [Candidatus Binataceae bacterium]|nr:flagellar filament capping protein FliD [Candidatus Binataceae bacterium]